MTANAKRAVLLNIFRQPDSNTAAVADAVHAQIDDIRRTLPKGIELQPFYDQSDLVNDSIKSVRDAVLIGLILASLIMVLFLRDWGTSLRRRPGHSGHARGDVHRAARARRKLQPDDAGRSGRRGRPGHRRRDRRRREHRDASRRGQDRAEAIRSAIAEIRVPLIGSTITPIVVFLPLISITGVTGTFFRALAVTVGMALLTSLALALTWTPTLSHFFIRRDRWRHTGTDGERAHGVPPRVMAAYERTLRTRSPDRPRSSSACCSSSPARSAPTGLLGSDLLPEMDEGGFILDYIMPAGSSLDETNRVMTEVEQILRATPEVESTSRRTGLQLGLAAVTEANTGDIAVKLKRDRSARQRRGDFRGAGEGQRTATRRWTWNSFNCCRT